MIITDYKFGGTILRYLRDEEGRISFVLIPAGKENLAKAPWEEKQVPAKPNARYNKEWNIGSMVQLHLRDDSRSVSNGNTMKYSESTTRLRYKSQEKLDNKVITTLSAEGYSVIHTITYTPGYDAFIVETEFVNDSETSKTLEMLSSFAMDNLSIFQNDDAPEKYYFHRFRSGWSMEGKHVCESMEELNLEKTWVAAFHETEKFGCIGTWVVGRYFPMASFEDREHNVFWTAQIAHNASWQMEFSRNKDTFSFSGGLADEDFGAWAKTVAPGESFKAPVAYIGVSDKDIYEACQAVTKLQELACDEYGEEGLPLSFNEFCTSWGTPTQEKFLNYAELLKDRNVKYLVIDAGWSKDSVDCQHGNGEWMPDESIFPDMKSMCDKVRSMGMIPGIWMEFEVTTDGSPAYEEEYDDLKLKRNGVVINTAGWRTFWDFRNPEVVDILTERVINFLKKYGFGYLKVDYNGSIGIGCDGAESLGEGLRQHMDGVADFFKKIKEEIPDIIIENCASGGHRSEPKMMGLTAVTSFSDAHEAVGIPYVAANLHNLMLPRQSLIWAVIRRDDTKERIIYQMTSTLLGRMCLSGHIDELSKWQWEIVDRGMEFYRKCENIIKSGITKIYGDRSDNLHHPKGTQVALRYSDTEILAVCHAYENPNGEICIDLPYDAEIMDNYYGEDIYVKNSKLYIPKMDEFTAKAVLLNKK